MGTGWDVAAVSRSACWPKSMCARVDAAHACVWLHAKCMRVCSCICMIATADMCSLSMHMHACMQIQACANMPYTIVCADTHTNTACPHTHALMCVRAYTTHQICDTHTQHSTCTSSHRYILMRLYPHCTSHAAALFTVIPADK